MIWWQWFLLLSALAFAGLVLWLRSVARASSPASAEPALPAAVPPRKRRTKAHVIKFTPDDKARRQAHWRERMPQLLANVERRPYWQFRTADDGRDNAACQADHGRIERHDSEFWQRRSPAKCRRVDCRCTIRAYGLRDLQERGIEPPP